MLLPSEDVRYAKFDPNPATSDPLEVHLLGQWRPLVAGVEDDDGAWSPAPFGTVHAIQVAGPQVTDPPAGALPLPLGDHTTKVKRASSGEQLTCRTGTIHVRIT